LGTGIPFITSWFEVKKRIPSLRYGMTCKKAKAKTALGYALSHPSQKRDGEAPAKAKLYLRG